MNHVLDLILTTPRGRYVNHVTVEQLIADEETVESIVEDALKLVKQVGEDRTASVEFPYHTTDANGNAVHALLLLTGEQMSRSDLQVVYLQGEPE